VHFGTNQFSLNLSLSLPLVTIIFANCYCCYHSLMVVVHSVVVVVVVPAAAVVVVFVAHNIHVIS
jgi:hypothetical protein